MSSWLPDIVCEEYDGFIVKNARFEESFEFSDSLSDYDVVAGGKKLGLSSSDTWFDCHTMFSDIVNEPRIFTIYMTPSETDLIDVTECKIAKFEIGIKHKTDSNKVFSLARFDMPVYEDWAEKRG